MNKETGGPAFPFKADFEKQAEGMTLRDYFAAKAMQGILGNSALLANAIEQKLDVRLIVKNSAAEAYSMADAMLAERAK